MLKKAPSFVLASVKASEYGSASRSLRPRWLALLNILDQGVVQVLERGPAFHDPQGRWFSTARWMPKVSSGIIGQLDGGGRALGWFNELKEGLTGSRRS